MKPHEIETITILSGFNRRGEPEPVSRLDLKMGDVISIVGPTGSGKTTLINDIELFAAGDTHTSRKVLLNGEPASRELREDPASNPIALITQHTTFLSDLPVRTFLETHARIRGGGDRMGALVGETLEFANELTGEPILEHIRMTELSGGQTRALLVADAAIICNTPIVLLDEVENAGIHRSRAIELLRNYRKIFIFVTHDPRIALLSDYRVVMREGSITAVLRTSPVEKTLERVVAKLDDGLAALREKLRVGAQLEGNELEALAV